MGFLAKLWELFKYDMLPRADRPAFDLVGGRRACFLWLPLLALGLCVVIGLISVVARAVGAVI